MKPPSNWTRLVAAAALLLAGAARLPADVPNSSNNGDITAVAAKAADDYVRDKLPDGRFRPETFAFGNGGYMGGGTRDPSIDKLDFVKVAQVLAEPLSKQGYVPTRNMNATKLLIMVYWGTTTGTHDISDSVQYQNAESTQVPVTPAPLPQFGAQSALMARNSGQPGAPQNIDPNALVQVMMANHQRDVSDMKNILLLGYDEGMTDTGFGNFGIKHDARTFVRDDLIHEVEYNRYFVVLMAYDFNLAWKEKKHKLLWETRFSISERRNSFDKVLPAMASYASKYFGRDSNGLVRDRLPEGRVEVGSTQFVGFVPDRADKPEAPSK